MSDKLNSKENGNAQDNNEATVSKKPLAQHPETVTGMLEVGTLVSVNKTLIEGKITGYHLSADNTTLSYLVDYEEDGEKHKRAFTPNQISKK